MRKETNNESELNSGVDGHVSTGANGKSPSTFTLKVVIAILIALVLGLGGFVCWYCGYKDKGDGVETVSDAMPERRVAGDTVVAKDTIVVVVKDSVKTGEVGTVAVQQIVIIPSTLVLTKGEQFALQYVMIPKNATHRNVTWSSSMPEVVRVDEDGVVTAEQSGNAVIRVTAPDGEHVADCRVFVEKGTVEVVSDNELKFTFGFYKGEIKNGKAHGMGTMYYTLGVRISPFDDKARAAEPGDYVSGEFYEGKLVQGKWFAKEGKQKGTLIIGRAR